MEMTAPTGFRTEVQENDVNHPTKTLKREKSVRVNHSFAKFVTKQGTGILYVLKGMNTMGEKGIPRCNIMAK
jgi:hypothetical protein